MLNFTLTNFAIIINQIVKLISNIVRKSFLVLMMMFFTLILHGQVEQEVKADHPNDSIQLSPFDSTLTIEELRFRDSIAVINQYAKILQQAQEKYNEGVQNMLTKSSARQCNYSMKLLDSNLILLMHSSTGEWLIMKWEALIKLWQILLM